MYQDNMSSTIRLIGHKGNTGRMKHIALRYDFVREQVRLGTIRIEHLHTTTKYKSEDWLLRAEDDMIKNECWTTLKPTNIL